MAETTVQNGQTCLEIRGMEERHRELVRRTYSADNPYGPTHPDALADGDVNGKGVGGGHTAWTPDCTKPTKLFDYSNFTTSPEIQIGGLYDIEGRNGVGGRRKAMAASMYNYQNAYGADLVNTQANIADGQLRLND